MSRNRNRAKIHHTENKNTEPKIPDMPKAKQEPQNPLGISFVVPTEVVYLPSGGNFYEEDSPVNGLTSLEIRHMTSKEEDILTNKSFLAQGTVIDRLLDSIIVTPDVKAEDLLDCDKMATLACARKTGYGPIISFTDSCPVCGHHQEFDVNVNDFLDRVKDNPYEIEDGDGWKYNKSSNTITVELSVPDLNVDIRLLSTKDFEFLEQSKAQKEKHNLPYSETIEFLRRIMVSANGITDPKTLYNLAEVLPTVDARKLKYVHNVSLPSFDTKAKLTCVSCSAEVEKEVPFSVGWFWSIG